MYKMQALCGVAMCMHICVSRIKSSLKYEYCSLYTESLFSFGPIQKSKLHIVLIN